MELKKWTDNLIDNLIKFANNKKIADNLRDVFPHPYTKEDAEKFIDFCKNVSENKQINLAIIQDEKAIGGIGVTFGEDIYSKSAELGYWLAEEYWGRGIASDAVIQICDFIFKNYDIVRIYAIPFSYNQGSCRVLEKSGFVLEGCLKKSIFKHGKYFDSFLYSKIK